MRSPGTVSKPETCVSGRFRPSTVMKDSLDLERLLVPLAIAATFSVAASFSLPAVAFAASFRGLGVLPGGEYPYSKALDISADGSVVVGESLSANGLEAFRWSASTGMVGLGNLGGVESFSSALGVSADGLVVVGGSSSPQSGSRSEAFRWTAATGMVGLGALPGGEEYSSAASGVSGDGSVATGSSTSDLSPTWGEAFRWTEVTGLVGLGVLPGSEIPTTVPERISADGTVLVGWAFTENGREAFRWSEADGLVGLGDLPAGNFDSWARGVSADGSVIVGSALNPGPTSFLWAAATGLVDLGRPPGGNSSSAWGVSADGLVVVGDAGVAGERVPAIWDESHGMRNLVDVLVDLGLASDMAGWDLELAKAVSADGLTVVGWGYNPSGGQEAWIANLGQPSLVEIPTVSRAALIVFGALLATVALVTLRLR